MNSTGSIVSRYTFTQNIDEPLAMRRSGSTSYYQADALGSVTSLTSSTGSVANTYTYDSFGNVTNSTGSLRNPFSFAGREYDNETSLYFNRARYYNPSTGRFISEDPIRFWGGVNFYRYVFNGPTNLTDPLGLCNNACIHANFLQQLEINALAYYANKFGKTFGIGAGASGGAGYVFGVSAAASGQLVVSPNGQAALIYTYGSNTVPLGPTPVELTHGSGWLTGLQVSISNAQNPQQLRGNSVDFNGGYGAGAALGGDVSFGQGGVWQGTLTFGAGGGGWGGAGVYQNTAVVPFCRD